MVTERMVKNGRITNIQDGYDSMWCCRFFSFWRMVKALQTLIVFMVIDYLTGIIAAGREGKLSSQIGAKGISRKVMIFIFVALGHSIDQYLGGGNSIFRDGTIAFFIANEFLSITENASRMGIPIPNQISKALDLLKQQDRKEEDKK